MPSVMVAMVMLMLELSKELQFFHYVSNSICLNENELFYKCNNPANDTFE